MLDLQQADFRACARQGGERIALLARPDKQVWAVAQAIGNHCDADWAAATVIRQLENALECSVSSHREQFLAAVSNANSLLFKAKSASHQPVQSAIAALGFNGTNAFGFWIGNCRIYRLRNGRLTLLSEDHDVATAIANRSSNGIGHLHGASLSRVLTRAIGCAEAPETARFVESVKPADRFLICGAGLARTLHEDEIARQLSRGIPQEAMDRLQGLHLSRGGLPNFGAVVIDTPGAMFD